MMWRYVPFHLQSHRDSLLVVVGRMIITLMYHSARIADVGILHVFPVSITSRLVVK